MDNNTGLMMLLQCTYRELPKTTVLTEEQFYLIPDMVKVYLSYEEYLKKR